MSISIKTPDEIEKMRVAGRLASELLDYRARSSRPALPPKNSTVCATTTWSMCRVHPAPLNYAPSGYNPYPKAICTSINHQVCHGVPSDRVLKNGDIINLDITPIKDGYHGDTSRMF
jgi:methionyl aminopeptidase